MISKTAGTMRASYPTEISASIPPSTVFHYGAEIFEGLKAYRRPDGEIQMFRPVENIRRMNNSAERPLPAPA